jgi:uncharacterized GH25 family protein
MGKRSWAVVAAVLVGGLAVWMFFLRAPSRSLPAAKAPGTAPHEGGRRAAGGGEDQGGPPAVLVDDDPKGTLRLEGQVIDADEHPVAGATVVLGSNPPRTLTTEGDGGFAFDGLVGRPYTLIARAPQGIAGPVTARLTSKSDPVILHLRPGAKVTVSVVGIDGKPIDGATVELRGTDYQKQMTKAGATTFAAVIPGGYQVAAFADGLATSHTFLEVGAGDNTVKLMLVAGAPVAGRVVDDNGHGVAGARVTYHGASDWSQQADDRYDGITSGADGAFKFAALPSGSFRFSAVHPDYAPGQSAMVTLDGKHEQTGVTITVPAGATVKGTVVDTEGKPVAGARVRVGRNSRRGMVFEPPRQAYSDGGGAFEIKGLPRHELAAVAMHETGSSKTEDVDTTNGDVSNVKLTIDVTGTISGIVVDPQGAPVEGVQVSAGPNWRAQGGGGNFTDFRLRGFPQELSDGAGKFTLTGLAPGSYEITAMRSRGVSRGRRGAADGVIAETGTKDLKIVLQPEGGVKGKVAMSDGSVPDAFSISVGMTQQSFISGDGSFELDALPPQTYRLSVRGPTFTTKEVEALVEPGKTADVGTITVQKGRMLAGTVVANGTPVPDATVYAGRQIIGNGSTNSANLGGMGMGQGTKTATTDASGNFSLAGFSDGDLAITAEHPAYGRSKALRIPTDMAGQQDLTIELQPFGALSGVLRQNGSPVEGIAVSCQSTTTPGAIYAVMSGADGSYRYDHLAPDTYKVSATVGRPMMGMKFYSQQVVVPSGQEVHVDLAVEPGAVTVDVTATPKSGQLGIASAWLASGTVTATTESQLRLAMAAAGAGSSQWVIIRRGEPAQFTEITPGAYSACVVPFPAQVQGMGAMGYAERHGDTLPAFCMPVKVNPSPETQTVSVPVDIPPYIPDQGSGAGSAH